MKVGTIVLFARAIAQIPFGWAICNGTGGTPDLTDQFIVGAKQDDAGVAKTNITGGLTQSGGAIDHDHTLPGPTLGGGVPYFFLTRWMNTAIARALVPYYAVVYIIKV